MKSNKRRKPAMTRRKMIAMLTVKSLAESDADMMDTPQEREHQREIYEGCQFIADLAGWWADQHGVEWPTDEPKKKPAARGGKRKA